MWNGGAKMKRQGYHGAKTGYAPDGHFMCSKLEMSADVWLCYHGIQHEVHPRIPGRRGTADFLVYGNYVEINGVRFRTKNGASARQDEELIAKYNGSGKMPIIISGCNHHTIRRELNKKLGKLVEGIKIIEELGLEVKWEA